MNTSKAIFQLGAQGRTRAKLRQFAAVIGLASLSLGTLGCSGGPDTTPGTLGYVQGFLGGVVADEPRAALIGRDILSRGGSAADAATAMYFTMAVTLPSRAGLGGGGVCLAFDAESGETDMLDFVARAPVDGAAGVERPSAIPANPRGFFALQARHGTLDWREVVAP
ncbi:MAG: gamma-glutamyltransferase, partial [Arenibacter algicola]|nr:gamma-glutamyltransferase [Arenibacter algicola]